jgi:hypothetical protein
VKLKRCNFKPWKFLPGPRSPSPVMQEPNPTIDLHATCMHYLSQVERTSSADWLDPSQVGELQGEDILKREHYKSVSFEALLFVLEEFSRRGLFSMAKLIRKVASSAAPVEDSQPHSKNNKLHMRLLRALPFESSTPNLLSTRRQCIYGNRPTESWEEATERRASKELQKVLPCMLESAEKPAPASFGSVLGEDFNTAFKKLDIALTSAMPRFWTAPPLIRRKLVCQLVVPALDSGLTSQEIVPDDVALVLALLHKSCDFVQLSHVST